MASYTYRGWVPGCVSSYRECSVVEVALGEEVSPDAVLSAEACEVATEVGGDALVVARLLHEGSWFEGLLSEGGWGVQSRDGVSEDEYCCHLEGHYQFVRESVVRRSMMHSLELSLLELDAMMYYAMPSGAGSSWLGPIMGYRPDFEYMLFRALPRGEYCSLALCSGEGYGRMNSNLDLAELCFSGLCRWGVFENFVGRRCTDAGARLVGFDFASAEQGLADEGYGRPPASHSVLSPIANPGMAYSYEVHRVREQMFFMVVWYLCRQLRSRESFSAGLAGARDIEATLFVERPSEYLAQIGGSCTMLSAHALRGVTRYIREQGITVSSA